MTAHWNTVQPTVIHFDGRRYQLPDHIACNWMHAGSAATYTKYCFCVHPDLAQVSDDHCHYDDFWHEVVEICPHEQEERREPLLEDNPYIVELKPDEFHELLSEYENYFEWCHKGMDARQRELAERVLTKLRQADAEHVCLDEMDPLDVNKEFPITSVTRADLLSAGFPDAFVEQLTDDEMREIASAMEDLYCDHGFWEDVELCTNRLLKRKEEDVVLEHSEHTQGDEDGLT